MADLVLTQMDREAAADLYCDWFSVSEANDSVKKLRAGKWDGLLVQAFAKHRLAEREAIEEIAAGLEVARWIKRFDDGSERMEVELSARRVIIRMNGNLDNEIWLDFDDVPALITFLQNAVGLLGRLTKENPDVG